MKKNVPIVEQYMTRMPHTVAPGTTLQDAHALMREYQFRHLPVLEADALIGILSLRDLHLIETLKDVDPTTVPVSDAMSPKPFTVAPGDAIDDVSAKMAAKKVGSAIVTEDGSAKSPVVGIFTTIDALIALLHVFKETP